VFELNLFLITFHWKSFTENTFVFTNRECKVFSVVTRFKLFTFFQQRHRVIYGINHLTYAASLNDSSEFSPLEVITLNIVSHKSTWIMPTAEMCLFASTEDWIDERVAPPAGYTQSQLLIFIRQMLLFSFTCVDGQVTGGSPINEQWDKLT